MMVFGCLLHMLSGGSCRNLIINLMSLIGKRVLIVGGNGYLGNYFASRFILEKASVMCLSR